MLKKPFQSKTAILSQNQIVKNVGQYYYGIDSPYDDSGKVIFSVSVLKKFHQYRQLLPHDNEAGGILLGYRRGGHFDIRFISEPQSSDCREPCFFERTSPIHQEFALKKWEENQAKIFYLGEWHTHPQSHPIPSSLDMVEWKKIKKYIQYPLLFVIVGTMDLWVGKG